MEMNYSGMNSGRIIFLYGEGLVDHLKDKLSKSFQKLAKEGVMVLNATSTI